MAKGNKGIYLPCGVSLIFFGLLFLLNAMLPLSKYDLQWVMEKDNLLLYSAIIFLVMGSSKGVGVLLTTLWVIMNLGLVSQFFGGLSYLVIPAVLVLGGIIMLFLWKR